MVMRKTPGRDTLSGSGSWAAPAPAARWQQRRAKKIRMAWSLSQPAFSTAGHEPFLLMMRGRHKLQQLPFFARTLLNCHASRDLLEARDKLRSRKEQQFSQKEAGDDSMAS